jgi:pimeloyl-ACP methyl ester carboxylesterase
MKKSVFYLLCFLLMGLVPAVAQDDALPTPEPIDLEAADGAVLKGDLYQPETIAEGGAPALLLMHQYQSNRGSYKSVIPDFLAAGYVVLTVDLRGHGETGGTRDWVAAQTDTLAWMAWLREQEGVNPKKVAVIGASIGSNLALVGCAQDPDCVTAIALSPGLDYFGVKPQDFVVNDLATRSALLIAGSRDRESADAIRSIFVVARGRVDAEMFPTSLHGTAFFSNDRDRGVTMAIILTWLEEAFSGVKD